MSLSPELVSGVLIAIVGGGGLWAYLGGKGKNKVDLVQIAQDAAAKVIHGLTHELARQGAVIERQDKRIEDLELQDERCRAELAELKRKIG